MSSLSRAVKKLAKSAKKTGRNFDRERLNAMRNIGARTVGGRNLGAFGLGKKRVPTADSQSPDAGLPGSSGAQAGCIKVDRDGSARRPYTIIGRGQLAAAAQAINTNLLDFLAAANVDDIVTDNVVPFGVSITQAKVYVSVTAAAAQVANKAMLAGCYIKWLVNGIEEARWPLSKFKPVYTLEGTAANSAAGEEEYDTVPFLVDFDPDKTYALQLFTTKAFTPAAVVDLTMVLDGMR